MGYAEELVAVGQVEVFVALLAEMKSFVALTWGRKGAVVDWVEDEVWWSLVVKGRKGHIRPLQALPLPLPLLASGFLIHTFPRLGHNEYEIEDCML